jgi:hypothetical protein
MQRADLPAQTSVQSGRVREGREGPKEGLGSEKEISKFPTSVICAEDIKSGDGLWAEDGSPVAVVEGTVEYDVFNSVPSGL